VHRYRSLTKARNWAVLDMHDYVICACLVDGVGVAALATSPNGGALPNGRRRRLARVSYTAQVCITEELVFFELYPRITTQLPTVVKLRQQI
jgi:hypothetical protein